MFLVFKAFLALLNVAQAHMQLWSPIPFNASNNPHTSGLSDDRLHYPYKCCGRKTEYPCRGYLSLLGTPAGAPTAIWASGSQQNWSMAGPAPLGGNHYGGSCQIGFSVDKGKTFRTVISYEGNCPHRKGGQNSAGQTFNFTVPDDLPSGEAVFAWTWVNREQEFNMNCAAVVITKGNGGEIAPNSSVGEKSTFKHAIIINTTSIATKTVSVAETISACGPLTAGVIRNLSGSTLRTHSAMNAQPIPIPNMIAAFNKRPEMFVADAGNGCLTPKTDAELKFPKPGEYVVKGDGLYPLRLPSGNCSIPV